MKFRLQHLHFVGIGGSGMSGIAEVLHNQGYRVSGSDAVDSPVLGRLASLGIRISLGHSAENLGDAHAVVISTAVKQDNPELLAAKARKIPVVPRALMLAELMRMKSGIAIAGTHGKTTTTSLVASVLAEGGLDPTFVIGGRLLAAGANARLGTGEFLVAEADESDASFLYLSPTLAVITNIDTDHMETYGHSVDRLKQAFVDFAQRLPFYGSLYACSDDTGVNSILPRIAKPIVTYGLNETADVRATAVRADGPTMHFNVERQNRSPLAVILKHAGVHSVRNALAAIAIAQDLGVDDSAVVRSMANFGGVGRRFQQHGAVLVDGGSIEVIDDYGHHPEELKTTLAAARDAYPGRRLVLAFQPHRYTRTRDLFEDFSAVLSSVDVLILGEVYAAGEEPVAAADGRALARAIRLRGLVEPVFVEEVREMAATVLRLAKPDDVVMVMGAGSIGSVASQIVQQAKVDQETSHVG